MTRRRCSLPSLLVLVAAACGGGGSSDNADGDGTGGQADEASAGCNAIMSTNVAWSERSTLGFSADEVLSALGAAHQSRLSYADGTSTTLTLALQRTSGQVEFQRREYTSDQSGRELAVGAQCSDVLAIPVTLAFTTNDGAFAESWPLSLLADSATTATAYMPLDLEAMTGSYTVTEVDPAAFDEVVAFVTLGFAAASWSGSVSGQAIQSGSGPNATSSAQSFSIGNF